MGNRPTDRPWTSGGFFGSIGRAMDQSLITSVRAAERIFSKRPSLDHKYLNTGPLNYKYYPPPAVYQVPYRYSIQYTTQHLGVYQMPIGHYMAPPPGPSGPGILEPPPPYSDTSYPKPLGPPPPYRY